MKKVLIFTGLLSLVVLFTTLITFTNVMRKLQLCTTEYEYTLYNDVKGVSRHCFEVDGVNRCRIGKYSKKVKKIENKEVCK